MRARLAAFLAHIAKPARHMNRTPLPVSRVLLRAILDGCIACDAIDAAWLLFGRLVGTAARRRLVAMDTQARVG